MTKNELNRCALVSPRLGFHVGLSLGRSVMVLPAPVLAYRLSSNARGEQSSRFNDLEGEWPRRHIAAIKELLQRPCACRDLAECGRRIFAKKRAAHEP